MSNSGKRALVHSFSIKEAKPSFSQRCVHHCKENEVKSSRAWNLLSVATC